MTTISVSLDDEVNAALDALCAGQGQDKAAVVADLVRRYVQTERLKRSLQDPELIRLYQEELADEDVALANEGMDEYKRLLEEDDHS